jgi:hypothetical protein
MQKPSPVDGHLAKCSKTEKTKAVADARDAHRSGISRVIHDESSSAAEKSSRQARIAGEK